jgi:hypothetical protein
VACGMNHVLLAYLDAIGEDVQPLKDYELDLYHINVLRDIPILMNKIVHGQFSYQDIYMYFRKKLGHIFSKDDVLPFFTAIQVIIQEIINDNGIQNLIKKMLTQEYISHNT